MGTMEKKQIVEDKVKSREGKDTLFAGTLEVQVPGKGSGRADQPAELPCPGFCKEMKPETKVSES